MQVESKVVVSSVITYRSVIGRPRRSVQVVVGLLWLCFALAISLVVAGGYGLMTGYSYPMSAVVAMLCGAFIAGYAILFLNVLRWEGNMAYDVTLTPDAMTLRMRGTEDCHKCECSMRLEDVDFVEWFTPRDSETLTFNSRDGRECIIPMWRMDRSATDAVAFLRARGIEVRQV